MSNIKWRIYPSLMNKFQRMKEGKDTEQDVLDMINHKEVPKTEPMLRGTAYHTFTAEPFPNASIIINRKDIECYKFQFWEFPKGFTDEIREERAGGVHETYNEREFDTGRNEVMLFCFADTLKQGIIYDLKLTGFYRGLSFLWNWQHRLSLYVIPSRGFRYLITDFSGIYYEDYHQNFTKCLAVIVDELVMFMDENEKHITYEKIKQDYHLKNPRTEDRYKTR